MKTYLDCIPCFFRQAVEASRMVTDDEEKQKDVIDTVARKIQEFSLQSAPTEMGITIFNAVKKAANHDDPYKLLKDLYNKKAMSFYPRFKEEVENSPDPLLTALRFAIAGNIIDFGPHADFDFDRELEESRTRPFAVFDYESFKRSLEQTDEIFYIGDNAGEIVFDRLLIETINKPAVFVVREEPIINDATLEDARTVGMDKVAEVISNGSGAPGTILRLCSEEFLTHYRKAKFIISKGQGNFETLSEEKKHIFFLLKAKCSVVARHLGIDTGGIVLLENRGEY